MDIVKFVKILIFKSKDLNNDSVSVKCVLKTYENVCGLGSKVVFYF
jgi:hypothetical protein